MGRGAGGGKGGDQGEHAARHTYRTQSRARVSQAVTHVRPARRGATPGGLMQLAVIPKVGAGWGSASRPVVCPAKASVFSRRETYQGKSQSPVARRAGGRETNLLKPLDSLILGMGASLQAVAQANASGGPESEQPRRPSLQPEGEGSMGRRRLADAADHSGGVGATAWGQGHAKQLEKPSSSHRETGGAR